MRLADEVYAFMQKFKPWFSNLPVIIYVGLLFYSAWVSKTVSSSLILVLTFGVVVLSLNVLFWTTRKISDYVTGTKRNRQKSDNSCSVPDIGCVNFEKLKFDIPAEHHVAALSHLPDCEDVVSACVEGVASCLEGLQP
jgi:hypothetical protein